MKVLLTTLNAKYIHLNLAIRLLYEQNRKHNGLHWCEFTIKENPEDIANSCKAYDVVAFSCYIWNITQTLAVARALKRMRPSIKIMLGGPEVSYDYEEFIRLDEVDFIITGEGEIPFTSFLEHYPEVRQIPNMVYKEHGEVKYHPQQVMFDLNGYADINPYHNDPPEDLYNKVCYIETSRGCPYKCEFCLASLDNKVRYLPIDAIKRNLAYLMEHGRTIKFLDRTFNVKKDFTIDIFRFILERRKPGQVFQFEITADIVHPDIVKFIEEEVPPGVFRFEIGIQTVNQKANLEVSRKQNFEKTSSVIRKLSHKIDMHLDLIVGLPLDTWDDIRYSIEQVFYLHPPELQLGFLKFLRGTPVRYKHAQHGYVFDPMPPYQIIESNYLSRDELHRITLLEEALEIYWNKKRAVQTLTYLSQQYSIFDGLLLLGEAFHQQSQFHKHTLYEAFDVLQRFVSSQYPDNRILHQMVGLDYYLHHKLKPKPMYLPEVSRADKKHLLNEWGLTEGSIRYVPLQVDFNVQHWLTRQEIIQEPQTIMIQYDGQQKGTVLCNTSGVLTHCY